MKIVAVFVLIYNFSNQEEIVDKKLWYFSMKCGDVEV